MLKYFFTFIIGLVISLFAAAQEQHIGDEEKAIRDFPTRYEMNFKYHISDDERDAAARDITEILGGDVQDNFWSTPKEREKFVMVKLINNFVFLRGFDRSEERDIQALMIELEEALSQYADGDFQ